MGQLKTLLLTWAGMGLNPSILPRNETTESSPCVSGDGMRSSQPTLGLASAQRQGCEGEGRVVGTAGQVYLSWE